MLGVLFTGWSAGGNGEQLMAALQENRLDPKSKDAGEQIAATIRAGLKEMATPRTMCPKGR
jgi:hypothetical protein